MDAKHETRKFRVPPGTLCLKLWATPTSQARPHRFPLGLSREVDMFFEVFALVLFNPGPCRHLRPGLTVFH